MIKLSSYTILIIFVILILTGSALVSRLSFQLEPSASLPSITVSYTWPDMSGRVVEQDVTSVLESGFSRMKGVDKISSTSSNGKGTIRISFDRSVNFDAARFEASMIIRQLYPHLPDRVSYPQIYANRPDDKEVKPLLTYTLNASASPYYIQKYAEDNLKPLLASIEGIYQVSISGAMPMEWRLEYNANKLEALGMNPDMIGSAIRQYIQRSSLGNGFELSRQGDTLMVYLNLRNDLSGEFSFEKIPITSNDGRIIYLTDLVTIRRIELEPQSFYRINGLNTINVVVTANTNANHLKISEKVKEKLAIFEKQLPKSFKLLLSYDSTEFVGDEMKKISIRTLFTLFILFLFVLLVSREWKYLLLIVLTLIASLTTAAILYYLFRIEMHLYSLMGITISLGMILDNAILMIDHIRHKQNRKVFLALLAATLSTISALTAVFFLPEEIKLSLADFSYIVIINLSVSLLVALFFIPALMEKLKLYFPDNKSIIPLKKSGSNKRKRRIVKFSLFYEMVIGILTRRRAIPVAIIILLFGLPVFLLPAKLEGDKWYHQLYNKTIGSEQYIEKVKPVLDNTLGGTFRLFAQNVFENSYYRNFEQTVLNVRAQMPYGSTVKQLNDLMVEMEKYLLQFVEIKQFQTSVYDGPSGVITIYFKKEYEYSGFPYVLYNKLISKAIEMGGPDWSVTGVGDGFSNAAYEQSGFYRILTYGYNYDELCQWGEVIKKKLMENPRVQQVNFLAQDSWEKKVSYQYVFKFKSEKLALAGISPADLYNSIKRVTATRQSVAQTFINKNYEQINLYATQAKSYDLWDLQYQPVTLGNITAKISDVATISTEQSSMDICRINQQYQLILAYDYVGSAKLGKKHLDHTLKEIKLLLPMGYSAVVNDYNWFWKDNSKQYWLLPLIIVIIFFVCSILLESLRLPFVVIFMIPVSYIGLFITFYLFDINFDQGGFAAFILLSGISVNSALYILNDYNNLRKQFSQHNILPVKLYIKAYQQKIIPILLTTVSTSLGLVPFLIGGQHEAFWFALASGTIGGIVFSVIGIVLVLPVIVPFKSLKSKLTISKD